ncbi:HlyD family efflux transporter periplasmic adaptor subunit [Klebsiella pneumoniae]|uniref:HlyD family efflux transporter periplasmic adaptor subunit n=1 Tax=Klebsiella pneumoniae TaxID=573 RepID=UPI001B315462|nr:HlyD family efflux transporter periplasmic adaptor subunit [Klebsiella pneumoniae]QTT69437.1 HlyD family efflux transporter periplasmic adaptor subunit [Klebsiella pneumoniae]
MWCHVTPRNPSRLHFPWLTNSPSAPPMPSRSSPPAMACPPVTAPCSARACSAATRTASPAALPFPAARAAMPPFPMRYRTLDTQQALVNQYRGSLQSNQADVATAKLNLDFTQIRAPIAGRLGLRQLDIGNLVSSGDTTPLVVITKTDPISVVFTIPEGDLPAVLQRRRDGATLVVEAWDRGERLKLAEGVLESLDNQIDTTTGTVKLKALYPDGTFCRRCRAAGESA